MRFCNNCDNMYYIQIKSEESDELMYYCRKCGDNLSMSVEETLAVTSSNLNQEKSNFDDIINKYTKFDPTLPKVNYISCPFLIQVTSQSHSHQSVLEIGHQKLMKRVSINQNSYLDIHHPFYFFQMGRNTVLQHLH